MVFDAFFVANCRLFPSTADNVSVGSASGSSPPPSLSPRLELYRPFAAHCLGFPIVTLGFRVKSFFSKWRMRVRKEEVMRQNEFFERILASAVPSTFEDRRHFISSRHYLDLEQDAIDYELESAYNEENMGSNLAESRLYSQPSCTGNSESSTEHNSTQKFSKVYSRALPSGLRGQQQIQQQHAGQQISTTFSNNNGLSSSSGLHRRNGGTAVKSTSNWASTNLVCNSNGGNTAPSLFGRKNKQNLTYSNRNKHLYSRLWGTFVLRILNILTSFLCSAIINVYKVCGCPVINIINNFLHGLRGSDPRQLQQQDDLISSSGDGDGSHIADDESDQEEQLNYQYTCLANGTSSTNSSVIAGGKKKSRRTRGRTPLCGGFLLDVFNSQSSTVPSYSEVPGGVQRTSRASSSSNLALFSASNTQVNGHVGNSTGPSIYADAKLESRSADGSSNNLDNYATCNGKTGTEDSSLNHSALKDAPIGNGKAMELKQICKDKELEKLKAELRTARGGELELRAQLSQAQQQERLSRNELAQSKCKLEQLDSKYKQLSKQTDNYKATISVLDKRIGEAQLKKNEVEQELANERLRVATSTALANNPKTTCCLSTSDSNQTNKAKMLDKERIINSLKLELQTKEEHNQRLEKELKLLRNSANKQSDQEIYFKQIRVLEEKNSKLEQTLSSENRLKQDLFRALNDSKAQIQALNVRLRSQDHNGSVRQNSQTPPPAFSSALSLDASINAIMQATGAQHIPDREPMFKQNLFSDGREAMSVWKNLRSSYKKKKDKKLPSGSASEPEKQKWVHYAEMNFLKNHIVDRIAQSSTLVQCSELVIDEEGENQSTSKRESQSSCLSQSSPVVRKKERVMDEFESKMLELVEKEEICTLARDVDEKMKKISGARHARIKMAFERAVREQIYQVDEYLLDNQMLRSKLALLVLLRRRKRQKKGRRYWVHPLWRNRPELGAYFALLPQLKVNPDKFFDYMRMNPEVFATLLRVLNEKLTKYSIRTPICAEERLMLTIRYLATDESYRSLSFQFRMGCMTVCRIISDTCSAIYEVLHQDYLAMPKTAEEWHQVALRSYSFGQLEESNQQSRSDSLDADNHHQPSLPSDLLIIGSHRTAMQQQHNNLVNNTANNSASTTTRTN
uniref:Uncharacterized protein n=1 Tax=Ditylenchus dipsaci TaxID=166011 RepID=A0A915DGU2_9BILA